MDPIIVDLQRKGFDGLITDLQKTGQEFLALDVAMEQAQKRLFELPKGSAEFKKIEAEVKAIEAAMKAAATSTGKLTQELTKTTNELGQIKQAMNAAEAASGKNTETFKNLEAQYEATRKKGEEIKNTLKGIRSELSDTHGLDIAVRGISTLVSGYGILQGVSALLGKENKGLQESLVKLNAIMLVGNSIQQISVELNRTDSVVKVAAAKATALYAFAVGSSTGALKAFRIALAATGIGLLIIGVATLIANFDNLTKSGGFLSRTLESITYWVRQAIQGYKDLSDAIGLTDFAAKKATEDEKQRQQDSLDDLERTENLKIDILRIQHKSALDEELKQLKRLKGLKEKALRDDNSAGILSDEEFKKRQKEIGVFKDDIAKKEAEIDQFKIDEKEKADKKAAAAARKAEAERIKAEKEAAAARKKAMEGYIEEAVELQQTIALQQEELNKLFETVKEPQVSSIAAIEAVIERLQRLIKNVTIGSATFLSLSKAIKTTQDQLKEFLKTDEEKDQESLKTTTDILEKNRQAKVEADKKQRDDDIRAAEEKIEEEKEKWEKIQNIAATISSAIEASTQIATDVINLRANAELAALEEKKKRGLISEKEYEKQSAKIKNEAAEKQRKVDIATASAKIPLVILNALSSAPFPFNLILAAIAGALAAAQLAILIKTPLPKFKHGGQVAEKLGLIEGKPHSQGGKVIEVEGHEYVMPTEPTKKHLPALEAMRKGTFDKLFIPTNLIRPDIFSRISNPSTIPNPVRTNISDNTAIESKLKVIADELWYLRYETKLGNKDRRSGTDKVVKNLSTKQSGYQ